MRPRLPRCRERCFYCRRLRFRRLLHFIELDPPPGGVWKCRRPCRYGWWPEFRKWLATNPPGPPPDVWGDEGPP